MLKRTIFVLGFVISALIALEFAARWLLDDIGTTGDNTSWFAERWRATQKPIRNSLGFREREFEPLAAPAVYRIAVVGDSFIYGQGIAEPERLTELLARALNEQRETFEVLNFGQPGANYEQNLHNLQVALDTAHPDFVLLSWFLNDIDDPERPAPRALPLLPKLHYYVNPRSALYFVLNNAWVTAQIGLEFVNSDEWYREQYADATRPLARRARQRLERLLRAPKERGVPVAMIMWPPTLRPGFDGREYDFIFTQIHETCEAENVPCLDLRPTFDRHAGENLVVNRFDAHPNGRANEIAAAAVRQAFGERWRELARRKANHGLASAVPVTTERRRDVD